MIDLSAARCVRHRGALLDFVDRREIGPWTGPALDHLERCRACASEVQATALAITAVRRLYDEVRVAEPRADAWLRLRSRIDRPRAALWRWRTTLAGLVVGAGLVGTLLAPSAIWRPRLDVPTDGNWTSPYLDGRPIEWDRLLSRRPTPEPITILVPLDAAPSGMRWAGPDGRGHTLAASIETPPPGRAH